MREGVLMLRRMIYTSEATFAVNKNTLTELVRKANNHNIRDGLTGALFFKDGVYLQLLEGEEEGLGLCFRKRIAPDPRHANIQIRQNTQVTERTFPLHWMALHDMSFIDAAVFSHFEYEHGFPPEKFDPETLRRFLIAAFG
jgi:hypothetical protein